MGEINWKIGLDIYTLTIYKIDNGQGPATVAQGTGLKIL